MLAILSLHEQPLTASTTDPMKLNNVGSSIADKAGNTFLDKIDAAAGDNNTKNGAVKRYWP